MRRFAAHAALVGTITVATTARAQAPAPAPACTTPATSCAGDSGYYVASDDREKLEKQLDPLLRELRSCLDAAGGKHVTPQIVIRFDSDGKPLTSKVEAGGYDSLPCVASVTAKLVNARSSRETSVRCEFGCPKPKPPPPPPPPPPPVTPVPAPTTTVPGQPPPPAQPAQPAPAPYTPPMRTEKVWYGWQNLATDAVTVPVSAAGFATQTGALTTVGLIGFAFASPIVHWVHGNIGKGFGSLAMRVFTPLIGAGVGAIAGVIAAAGDKSTGDGVGDSAEIGAWVGVGVGALIPILIDGLVFGYEKVEVPSREIVQRQPSFTIAPTLDARKGGGTVGIGGTF